MNDYSKYITKDYGFIRKYIAVVGKPIKVYTSRSKKNKPNQYELTEENKRKYDTRLGQQYELLHHNKEEIKKDITKNSRKKIYAIGTIVLVIAMILGIFSYSIPTIPSVISAIAATTGIGIFTIGELSLAIWKNNFDKIIQDQKIYLKEKESIEEESKKDENITRHLSNKSKTIIKSKEALRESGIQTEVFDVDFMDKVSSKDLATLIDSYMISKELENEPTYVSPVKEKVKKRTLTKQRNK